MTDMPVIAVLGARGMLGTDLIERLNRHGYPCQAYDLPELDITDTDQLASAVRQADMVVNCAAYTQVDAAETHQDLAFSVNAEAVGQLGSLARQRGIPVLHISTDFVFDGRADRPYVETDAPNPLSIYGMSKLKGEQLLLDSACRSCIVRVQWTYGRAGNNFVRKVLDRARQGAALKVVDDQIGSPTWTGDVSEALCGLLGQRHGLPAGIYHLAAGGSASRFEVAQYILAQKEISADLQPCKSDEFETPAQRPLNSRFNCKAIESLLGRTMRPWQDALKQFLERTL